MDNQVRDTQEDEEMTGEYNPSEFDEDAEAVLDQQEVIKMPVQDKEQAEIVTKFYDYNAEQDEQENGLVLYNNRYYQSTGIDIASAEGEAFDVVASLSGRSEEHTSELQSRGHLVCRLLLENKIECSCRFYC